MPTLSCCIITKNEAGNLTPLIKSLSTVCEQIVLVDTGSNDNTVQVAKALGAEVGIFPWNGSFSDARNKSLELARHPWILYVDADDYLPDKSLISIAKLKNEMPEKAFGFVIRSTQDGVTGIASAQIRMFPNKKGLRFKYRVHEQIRPALIERGIPILFTETEILHKGYTDKVTVVHKQRRNIKLLEKDLLDFPNDGFLHYLSGMGLRDLGEVERAGVEFQKSWELSYSAPDKRHIALGSALELADNVINKDPINYREALLWVERAESMEKDYPRCLYIRAQIDYKNNDSEKSLELLKRIMACEKPSLILPLDMTMLKATVAAFMGKIYIKTGRPQDAVTIIDQAKGLLRKPN